MEKVLGSDKLRLTLSDSAAWGRPPLPGMISVLPFDMRLKGTQFPKTSIRSAERKRHRVFINSRLKIVTESRIFAAWSRCSGLLSFLWKGNWKERILLEFF